MTTMTRDEFQTAIINAVEQRFIDAEWFSGVCMDGWEQFYPDRLQEAIDHAGDETFLWDGPFYGAGTAKEAR